MFKLIWSKKFVIVILALLVALLPVAMTREATALSRTIVTGIGIDKQGDDYTVYAEHIIFNFDPFGVMEREILKGQGKTIQEALTEIGHNQGRTVSFSHTTIILLGPGLRDGDAFFALEFFLRQQNLNNSAVVMATEGDPMKLMEKSIERGDVRSGKLQKIAQYNRNTGGFTHTTLDSLFKDGLTRGYGRVALVEVEEDEIENTRDSVKLTVDPGWHILRLEDGEKTSFA